MSDLSLISIDDLVNEIEKRCSSFICAYYTHKNQSKTMEYHYGNGNWFEAIQLSAMLHNEVMNNWNGELKTLQRINEEEEE